MLIIRRQAIKKMAVMLGGAGMMCGCRSAPITGRRQVLLLPEDQEIALGLSSYQDIIAKEPHSQNQKYIELVNRVGQRIAAVAGRPDYQWEFRVIASPTQNAFCLPGGKVAIYEGMLPVCVNEGGIAVVMSHEIAHALARHGGERMSHNFAVAGARQVVNLFTQGHSDTDKQRIIQAYGVASKYGVILPYSRKHESEADHMGLILMARAGYDPSEAPRFWERFAAMKGSAPIEFLSTHPADARRAADLRILLPQANSIYQQVAVKYGTGETLVATSPPQGTQPTNIRAPQQPLVFPSGVERIRPTQPAPTGIR